MAKEDRSPSPVDYLIKSSFEIIAEKGKTISDNRKRIKINEEIAKQNRKKYIVRRAIKVKSKEKEDNIKNNSD